MSIFVYYDVMVIIAFLSFIIIKDFLLSCVFVFCSSSLHQKQMNLPTP